MTKQEWKALGAECIGTALLVFGGISFVILNFGEGSPVVAWLPDLTLRRFVTGFLFGSIGCAITLSPLGRLSGAHLNPAVSVAFYTRGLLPWWGLLGYVLAQLIGACIGAEALRVWGPMGTALHEGVTLPGASLWLAFGGEAFCTFCLIATILFFTGHDRLKAFTPYTIPILFCLLVGIEGPFSGCSANPARSFGPALVSGIWTDHWLYWLGPLTGTGLALWLFSSPLLAWIETDIAKLYHFSRDEAGFLRGQKN